MSWENYHTQFKSNNRHKRKTVTTAHSSLLVKQISGNHILA